MALSVSGVAPAADTKRKQCVVRCVTVRDRDEVFPQKLAQQALASFAKQALASFAKQALANVSQASPRNVQPVTPSHSLTQQALAIAAKQAVAQFRQTCTCKI